MTEITKTTSGVATGDGDNPECSISGCPEQVSIDNLGVLGGNYSIQIGYKLSLDILILIVAILGLYLLYLNIACADIDR
jgi:hypothetical protein